MLKSWGLAFRCGRVPLAAELVRIASESAKMKQDALTMWRDFLSYGERKGCYETTPLTSWHDCVRNCERKGC